MSLRCRLSLLCLAMLLALPVRAAERLTFVTDWVAQAEHGGFYHALAEGLYAKRGLEVVLRPGGVDIDPQRLLAAGAVDIAMGSDSFTTLNFIQAGADVVTVAALFQKNPTILMTHPRDDVNGLADMKGKPILIGDPSVNTVWRWLSSRYGFEDRQIRKYTFNIAPFLVDRTTIQQGYATSEPFTAQKAGVVPEVYLLADEGYPSYAATILVQRRLIDTKPELVRAFVEASVEGWIGYLQGDPAKANALIKRDNPEMDDATLAYARDAMIRYGLVDSGDAADLGVGAMTEARWDSFTREMQALSLYPADLDWRRGVDFRFINQGHGR